MVSTELMLREGTFAGRSALVTGGGSGIGAAVALELARLGAKVAVVGRRKEPLQETVTTITDAGGTALWRQVDVRDRTSVEETLGEIQNEHGAIQHVVNSAAGNFKVAPEEMSPNAWKAVIDIVLNGTWNVSQTVAQQLINANLPGSMLSFGTTASMIGGPSTVHSSSAKAGVMAMTKSLAVAWADYGIRLNVLTPGPTENTPAQQYLYGPSDDWDSQVAAIPLKRMVTRQEIANAAAFLLSDYAGYITGTNLVVDGGRSLGRDAGVHV